MFQVVEVKFMVASATAVAPRVVRKFGTRNAAKEHAFALNNRQDLVSMDCITSYFVKEVVGQPTTSV